jgi:hypothetical protein
MRMVWGRGRGDGKVGFFKSVETPCAGPYHGDGQGAVRGHELQGPLCRAGQQAHSISLRIIRNLKYPPVFFSERPGPH